MALGDLRMSSAPAVCPRCSGYIYRDYEDWCCLSCGTLAPSIEEERRAELVAERTPVLLPGRVRMSKPAHHIIRGKRL